MPRLVYSRPKYRKHRQSGQALVTLNGRDFYLGPYGSKASRTEFDRLTGEWLARGRQPEIAGDAGLLIFELANRYWSHAQTEYVRNARPTAEQFKIKTALQHLLRFYVNQPATEFGLPQLEVVRQSMIESDWSRKYINQQVGVLVRMFKWAAQKKLVPPTVHAELSLVDGLRRGKTAARETEKVRPVDRETVQATLPFLSPIVRAMIELQLVTGMRPGELCILRPADVNRSCDVWEYAPADHKTAYREQDRLICIGPRGQDILRPFLLRASDSFCFSPAESMEWHRAARHEARITPTTSGNTIGTNRKRHPKRRPRDKFDVGSYRRSIHRGCDRAFPAPDEVKADPAALAKWQSLHRWSPHQLRHSMATRVRREFNMESAKAVLGHSAMNTTGIYAEIDRQRAIEVAKKIG